MAFIDGLFPIVDFFRAAAIAKTLEASMSAGRQLEVRIPPSGVDSDTGRQVPYDDWALKVRRHCWDFELIYPFFRLHMQPLLPRSSSLDTPQSVRCVVVLSKILKPGIERLTVAELRLYERALVDMRIVAQRAADTWYAMSIAPISSSSALHGITKADNQLYHQEPFEIPKSVDKKQSWQGGIGYLFVFAAFVLFFGAIVGLSMGLTIEDTAMYTIPGGLSLFIAFIFFSIQR